MYPCMHVNLSVIRNNATLVSRKARAYGIDVAGVVKFSDAAPEIIRAYYQGGCHEMAASRVAQCKRIKSTVYGAKSLLLRLPMAYEVEEVVRWCDTSMNTQEETLRLLNEAAGRAGVRHGVLLMLDVGDLREGVMTEEELVRLALLCEKELPHLYLRGVGSTFACFGSVLPDEENLGRLVAAAEQVERAIGRTLETISGGATVSLVPMMEGRMPERVNHLRVGGFIANPVGMHSDGFVMGGESEEAFLLEAQIIEVGEKPSVPFGKSIGTNWKRMEVHFEDHGVCRRAIAAIGEADVGNTVSLIPLDPGVTVIGSSSDHLILRFSEEARDYRVGDVVSFKMFYSAVLRAFMAPDVEKIYTGDTI